MKHWVFQGNSSVSGWQTRDGTKAVFFRDKDGLLTGTVNASVVPDFPLYKGPQCLDRPDWGNMMVCPYRYVKVSFAFFLSSFSFLFVCFYVVCRSCPRRQKVHFMVGTCYHGCC